MPQILMVYRAHWQLTIAISLFYLVCSWKLMENAIQQSQGTKGELNNAGACCTDARLNTFRTSPTSNHVVELASGYCKSSKFYP